MSTDGSNFEAKHQVTQTSRAKISLYFLTSFHTAIIVQRNMKAVITGGSKGIGFAIAKAMAKAGYDLMLCARNEQDLASARSALLMDHPSGQIYYQAVDLADKDQTKNFAALVAKQWSRLDVLVNNAGIFRPGQITTEEEGALEDMISANVYSAYHLTRALLPLMLPFKQGHIINLCSIASFMAYPNGGSYSISKFALLGFSKVLREELKLAGIKVTALMPGATWSDSWRGVDLPLDRLIESEDIAKLVMTILQLSASADVEELIIRPQLGDL